MTTIKTLPIELIRKFETHLQCNDLFFGEVKDLLCCDDVISEDDNDFKERLEASLFNVEFFHKRKSYRALWNS